MGSLSPVLKSLLDESWGNKKRAFVEARLFVIQNSPEYQQSDDLIEDREYNLWYNHKTFEIHTDNNGFPGEKI